MLCLGLDSHLRSCSIDVTLVNVPIGLVTCCPMNLILSMMFHTVEQYYSLLCLTNEKCADGLISSFLTLKYLLILQVFLNLSLELYSRLWSQPHCKLYSRLQWSRWNQHTLADHWWRVAREWGAWDTPLLNSGGKWDRDWWYSINYHPRWSTWQEWCYEAGCLTSCHIGI